MSKAKMTIKVLADGRVQVPAYIRNQLNINYGDNVAVTAEGGKIILTPQKNLCQVCHKVLELGESKVCKKCFNDLEKIYRG